MRTCVGEANIIEDVTTPCTIVSHKIIIVLGNTNHLESAIKSFNSRRRKVQRRRNPG